MFQGEIECLDESVDSCFSIKLTIFLFLYCFFLRGDPAHRTHIFRHTPSPLQKFAQTVNHKQILFHKQNLSYLLTIVHLAAMATISFSHELSSTNFTRPKYENVYLSNDDLFMFYYSVHVRLDGSRLNKRDGRELNDNEIKGICRIQVNKPEAAMPRVIAIFKNPNEKLTQKIAKVANKTQARLDELFDKFKGLWDRYAAKIQAIIDE